MLKPSLCIISKAKKCLHLILAEKLILQTFLLSECMWSWWDLITNAMLPVEKKTLDFFSKNPLIWELGVLWTFGQDSVWCSLCIGVRSERERILVRINFSWLSRPSPPLPSVTPQLHNFRITSKAWFLTPVSLETFWPRNSLIFVSISLYKIFCESA